MSFLLIYQRPLFQEEGFEKGQKVRIDSTGVESNIHYPTDATLLQDGIRVITRLLRDGYQLVPKPAYGFSDHTRVVKRRVLNGIWGRW